MKRKKLTKISLLIAAVMTLTGCSKATDDLYQLANFMMLSSGADTALPGKTDKEHEETLENIFDNINIMGATLSLPMNVSDLPEGFILNVGDGAIETYDGNHIVLGEMTFGDDITVCPEVYILKEKNQDVSQGIIVGFVFGYVYIKSLVYDKDGHNLISMSPADVTAMLGEREITISYMGYDHYVYTDKYGRRAGWSYDDTDKDNMMSPMSFSLTAHIALDYLHII